MPGAGGNSFTNNPLWDLVVHPAGADAGRGIPAVGKVVYRTDLDALEMCTDTTPDATDDGGGTWDRLLSGLVAYTDFTPTLTASTTDPDIDAAGTGTAAGYVRLGPICVAWYYIQFGAAMSAGSGTWRLDKPIAAAGGASANWCVGAGLIVDNSTGAAEFVILENRAAGDMYITYDTNTVAHNLPWTWAANDEMRLFVIYPIS